MMKDKLYELIKSRQIYVDLFKANLKKPIIDKGFVKENIDKILKDGVAENIIINKTSGTTGEFLSVYWDKKDYINSNMQLWHLRNKWYNICPNDKLACFYLSSNSNVNSEKYIIKNNVLSIKRGNYTIYELKILIEKIIDFSPIWIQAPISIMLLICNYVSKHNIKFSCLRYIELNGEFATLENINYIKNMFGVPVGNLYGSIEFNGIALTCPYNHMHVLYNNVLVETDDDNNLIITSLTNTYMPLIRYKIGDIGIIKNNNCACGFKGNILDLQRGRDKEVVELYNLCIDYRSFVNIVIYINNDYGRDIIKQYYINKENNIIMLYCVVLDEDIWDLSSKISFYKEVIPLNIDYGIKLISISELDLSSKFKLLKKE